MRWRPAYVALGSNLDRPATQVARAFERLALLPETRLVARSRLWASPPMGPVDQPDFVNAVAGLLTRLEPRPLLDLLKQVERDLGRSEPRVRWGPRVIDLDLLACGSLRVQEDGLVLPHPGVHERDFVLYPLAEIAPSLWIEGHGRVGVLLDNLSGAGARPLPE